MIKDFLQDERTEYRLQRQMPSGHWQTVHDYTTFEKAKDHLDKYRGGKYRILKRYIQTSLELAVNK